MQKVRASLKTSKTQNWRMPKKRGFLAQKRNSFSLSYYQLHLKDLLSAAEGKNMCLLKLKVWGLMRFSSY